MYGSQKDMCEICNLIVYCDENSVCRSCGGFSNISGSSGASSYNGGTYAQRQNSKINKESANRREYAKSLGCKALKGTPKQKKWAEDIRADFFKKFKDKTIEICAKYSTTDGVVINKASWWIENRSDDQLESKILKWNEQIGD